MTRHSGAYISAETNAETKQIYFQQKRKAISRNIREKVGENWAPIVQRKQRGDWPGAVCGSQRALCRASGRALAGQGLTQAPCLPLTNQSWHRNLKTFILDEVDWEKREEGTVSQPWL